MKNKLERFGSYGAIVAAAACPICFPKLALLGAIFGFGIFAEYETAFFIGTQILIILALAGHIASYKKYQNKGLLALAAISATLFFFSLYAYASEVLSYIALTGLVISTIWLLFENRRCATCTTSTTNPE